MTAHKIASGGLVPDDTAGPAPVSDALHAVSLLVAGVLRPRPDSSIRHGRTREVGVRGRPAKSRAADVAPPTALTPSQTEPTKEH